MDTKQPTELPEEIPILGGDDFVGPLDPRDKELHNLRNQVFFLKDDVEGKKEKAESNWDLYIETKAKLAKSVNKTNSILAGSIALLLGILLGWFFSPNQCGDISETITKGLSAINNSVKELKGYIDLVKENALLEGELKTKTSKAVESQGEVMACKEELKQCQTPTPKAKKPIFVKPQKPLKEKKVEEIKKLSPTTKVLEEKISNDKIIVDYGAPKGGCGVTIESIVDGVKVKKLIREFFPRPNATCVGDRDLFDIKFKQNCLSKKLGSFKADLSCGRKIELGF